MYRFSWFEEGIMASGAYSSIAPRGDSLGMLVVSLRVF